MAEAEYLKPAQLSCRMCRLNELQNVSNKVSDNDIWKMFIDTSIISINSLVLENVTIGEINI